MMEMPIIIAISTFDCNQLVFLNNILIDIEFRFQWIHKDKYIFSRDIYFTFLINPCYSPNHPELKADHVLHSILKQKQNFLD